MSERLVVLDTETTGFDPHSGDRMVEVGCVEIIDRSITENSYHEYINPQRDMPEGAFKVHGLSTEFLADKPLFRSIAPALWAFCSDATLVIHNAAFDLKFLDAELEPLHLFAGPIKNHCEIIDTLEMARSKHPGQRNTLDALCKRYGVDNSIRQVHGALLDAQLLAKVYLAMTGGQGSLFAEEANAAAAKNSSYSKVVDDFVVITADVD